MKITIFAVEKKDGTFEALYVGPNSDQALDMFTKLRANKGVDNDRDEAFVAAAVFQRPVTRKRAKFPENSDAAAPASKEPPAAKGKKGAGKKGGEDPGATEDTGI